MTENDNIMVEEVEVTDELGTVKRLNNRVKIVAVLVAGFALLIVMYGFSLVEKRNVARVAEADEITDEELGDASRPQTLQETETSGIIPAERPIPPVEASRPTYSGTDVPIVIPDASGEYAESRLAGPGSEEQAALSDHRAAMRQLELDHELEVKRYNLDLQMQARRNRTDTDRIAASSPMEISLNVNETDNLIQGLNLGGVPGSGQVAGALGGIGTSFAGVNQALPDPLAGSGGAPGSSTLDAQAALLEQFAAGGAGSSGGGGIPGLTQSPAADSRAQNNQAGKNAFLNDSSQDPDYLPSFIQEPVSPYEIKQGTIISGIMVTGLNSDLPGRIIGQVSQDVYDTSSGAHLLIPQGTRVFGRYDSEVSFGQSRALIVWNRLIYPNGKAINIAAMGGSDQEGYSGLRDKVNKHLLSAYGQAIMLSLVGTGIDSLTQSSGTATLTGGLIGGDSLENAFRQNTGDNLEQITSKQLNRSLDRQPTIKVRPGKPFTILVDQDMVLEPYRPNQR